MGLKDRAIAWLLIGAIKKDGIRRKIVLHQAGKEFDKIMNGKSKWKSKAVWTAIVGVVLGAVQPISAALGHPIEIPAWVYQVLGAFGLYAVRDGIGNPIK